MNEVIQGAKYRTIEDVKDAVKVWAISLKKEFRVLKSSSKEYEVRCADRDCTWRVYVYKGKFKTHWECSIVTPHTCRLTGVVGHHRNIWVGSLPPPCRAGGLPVGGGCLPPGRGAAGSRQEPPRKKFMFIYM